MKGRWLTTAAVLAVAAAVRLVMVVYAHARFPPIADGTFYHLFATRLAQGLGYTVAWPDGVVTFAAHYPVGYPAILSLAYRAFGATPGVGMMVNATIGAAAAACAHRVALRELSPARALVAALGVALHPALVLYTPAIMTEGVAAALVVIAIACAPFGNAGSKRVYVARIVATGIAFGVATLVRPQTVLLAPLLAFVFLPRWRALGAAAVVGAALLTVSPWTARNCVRMNRCALVSVNGGWNLLIGTQTTRGAWTELKTPPSCNDVFDEAAKDLCFERAARADIAAAPRTWLAKIPAKLSATFDVFAAGPWYLYRSNGYAFNETDLLVCGAIETLAARALLVLALLSAAPWWRVVASNRRLATTVPRFAFAALGIAFALMRGAWPAYAVLGVLCLIRDRGERASPIRRGAGLVVLATMATHAVFFGAGRYGLLVVPFVAMSAFACVRPKALSASAF